MYHNEKKHLTKTKQITIIKAKDFKVGEIVIMIPFENSKGEKKTYAYRLSRHEKLVPEIVK